jgi:hypothetical protein
MFAPGDTAKVTTIERVGNRPKPADEYFFVNPADADEVLSIDAQGPGTILNDDR